MEIAAEIVRSYGLQICAANARLEVYGWQIEQEKKALNATRRIAAAHMAAEIAKYSEDPTALAYYAMCRAEDQKNATVQQKICDELRKYYSDVVPASSFTSRTNLLGSSDIDIYIFQELKEQPPNMAFGLLSGQPVQHAAYESYAHKIDSVDVEIKFRPDREIMQLHEWLDTQMTSGQRVALTYIKHLNAHRPAAYRRTKQCLFNWALIQMGQEPRF